MQLQCKHQRSWTPNLSLWRQPHLLRQQPKPKPAELPRPLLAMFTQLSVFSKRIRWNLFKGIEVQNGDLLVGNCFPKDNELCKNNGRSDYNFRHLIETNTAQKLRIKETGLRHQLIYKRDFWSLHTNLFWFRLALARPDAKAMTTPNEKRGAKEVVFDGGETGSNEDALRIPRRIHEVE